MVEYLAPINVTCIPNVGVFLYSDIHMNFSDALSTCENVGGSLAHVISEHRTNALSNLIVEKTNISQNTRISNFKPSLNNATAASQNYSIHHAWIGLQELRQEGQFFTTTEMEPIECFLYRAWHPGHPK